MMAHDDLQELWRPEARAQLPFLQLLRLYLDPFALLRNPNVGDPRDQAQALQYNCQHRRMLLTYARRWTLIGTACLASAMPLCAQAQAEPLLWMPILGLEVGFSTALPMLLFSLALYVLLGVEQKKR
jgi:hypothetical protein